MKMILSLIALVILVTFSACTKKPEPRLITDIKYIKQEIPDTGKRPVGLEYNIILVDFGGNEYYAIPKSDGAIMSSNWESYKNWCETNYKILSNSSK